MIGTRLRQLRLARGLSLEALAAAMGGAVTKQALSKYEQDKARPSTVNLTKLADALGVKAAYLWTAPSIDVEFVAYRKGSTLPKGEQAHVQALVAESLETHVRLQDLLGDNRRADVPVEAMPVTCLEEADQMADRLRDMWHLGTDPIASVTDVMEQHYVHVLQVPAGEKFDGISAVAYGEDHQLLAAAVVTRSDLPGERQRLNLTHELGHLVLKIEGNVDPERAAFRFGAAFLAPAKLVRQEVGRRRTFIESQELLLLKKQLGLSLQALLFRLRDLEIITETYYRKWCVDISRLNWRKHEPFELAAEQSQWIRRAALRALGEGLLGKKDAEAMIGETIAGSLALPALERHAFMKLPLDERRRIMADQADKMVAHYEQDREWRELEAADIVDE